MRWRKTKQRYASTSIGGVVCVPFTISCRVMLRQFTAHCSCPLQLQASVSELQSKLRSQKAESHDSSKRRHEVDDLLAQLHAEQESTGKLQEANQSLRQEVTVHKVAAGQLKERHMTALKEKAEIERQLRTLRGDCDKERKARQELEKKNHELLRLSHEQEDEVSSLLSKLSEANDEAQRTKRMHTQVRTYVCPACLV